MQIESYCPAYQAKAVMWQSASPVQAAVQCSGQDPSASQQPTTQAPLQGQSGAARQGCAEEICLRGLTMGLHPVASGNADAVPASEATAHVHHQAPLQGQDPAVVQGFSQLPLWAPASMTTDAATCFAYLAGVLDERRRGKDATVQMHIDTAWKQLQMMLAGWLPVSHVFKHMGVAGLFSQSLSALLADLGKPCDIGSDHQTCLALFDHHGSWSFLQATTILQTNKGRRFVLSQVIGKRGSAALTDKTTSPMSHRQAHT